jgi:hypothetical protein
MSQSWSLGFCVEFQHDPIEVGRLPLINAQDEK